MRGYLFLMISIFMPDELHIMAFEDAIVTPFTFVFPALMSVRRNKIGILAVHFSSFCFCFSSRFEEHIIGKLSKLTQINRCAAECRFG